MDRKRRGLRYSYFFLSLLAVCLLAPIVKKVLDPLHFWTSSLPIIYCFALIIWLSTLRYRILRKDVWVITLCIAVLLILYISIREIKYSFLLNDPLERLLWYAYYIPMLLVPYLIFLAAKRMIKPIEPASFPILERLLLIPVLLLIFLIMTNDLHHWAFTFQPGMADWKEDYHYGPVYYLAAVSMAGFIITSLGMLRHATYKKLARHEDLLIFLPLVLFVIYLALYLGVHFRLYQLPEAFCFTIISMLEICIHLDLIHSNEGYVKMFSLSSVNAQIVDNKGNVIYQSAGALELPVENGVLPSSRTLLDPDTYLDTRKIHGGHVYWTEDISDLNELKELLQEQNEQLLGEQEILRAEIETKESLAITQTQNRIYDNIMEMVQPQIGKIHNLIKLSRSDAGFRSNLSWACVLNTYIKRRMNLALIAEQQSYIDLQELALSLREMSGYLKPCNVALSFHLSEDLMHVILPAESMLRLYDALEWCLENSYPALDALLINAHIQQQGLVFRLELEDMDAVDESTLYPALSDISFLNELLSPVGAEAFCQEEDGIVFMTIALPMIDPSIDSRSAMDDPKKGGSL